MNESVSSVGIRIADVVGLQIQDLHSSGLLRGTQPLLRIDNRAEAVRAPFQFDAAAGRLHRTDCRSIPKGSLSALYGVWRIAKEDQPLACPRCKPMSTTDEKPNDPESPMDVLYGVLSVVSQFGGVLRERGQEYRNSHAGKLLGKQIEVMYRGVGEREKNILDVLLASLDGLATTIRDLDDVLNSANGRAADGEGANAPPRDGHDGEAV